MGIKGLGFAVLYVVVGFAIAVPYCLLAGWNAQVVPWVAIVAPPFFFVWFLTAEMAEVIGYWTDEKKTRFHSNLGAAWGAGNAHREPEFLRVFWIWSTFCLLPVITRGASVLADKIGFETASAVLYAHRYGTPFYALVAMLAVVALVLIGEALRDAQVSKRLGHH